MHTSNAIHTPAARARKAGNAARERAAHTEHAARERALNLNADRITDALATLERARDELAAAIAVSDTAGEPQEMALRVLAVDVLVAHVKFNEAIA